MVNIGVHEYFRILVPAMMLVIIVKILIPDQLPDDTTYLILMSAFIGLLLTPITDRLCKKWFHRQIIKTKFYENFINHFVSCYKIKFGNRSEKLLKSFSGKIHIPECTETKCIIESYKIFARQGWGNVEENYRIRTEKSFGILYFTLFCYLFVVTTLYIIYMVFGGVQIRTLSGSYYLDILLLLALMSISFWESTARFRMSLSNELLILEAHMKEIKNYYDELIIANI